MRMRFGIMAAMLAVAMLFTATPKAEGQTLTLVALLSPQNENPPIVSGAFGIVTVTVDLATGQITILGRAYNLSTNVTAAHFHAGPPGANGPTVINFTLPGASNDFGFSQTVNASSFNTRGEQGIRSVEDVLQSLLSGMMYFNVHTTLNPGGEIRGQVCLVAGQANPLTGIVGCTVPAGVQ